MTRRGQSTGRSFALAARKIQLFTEKMADDAAPRFLRGVGEEIMTDCKASAPGHGVPVATGALRASGMVEQPAPLVVELGFGSAAVPYALTVHENIEANHRVGEARYLVRALERWTPGGGAALDALKTNTAAAIAAGGLGDDEPVRHHAPFSGGGGAGGAASGLLNLLSLFLRL